MLSPPMHARARQDVSCAAILAGFNQVLQFAFLTNNLMVIGYWMNSCCRLPMSVDP